MVTMAMLCRKIYYINQAQAQPHDQTILAISLRTGIYSNVGRYHEFCPGPTKNMSQVVTDKIKSDAGP